MYGIQRRGQPGAAGQAAECGGEVGMGRGAQCLDALVEDGRQGRPVLADTEVVVAGAVGQHAVDFDAWHRRARQPVAGFQQAAEVGIGLPGGDGAQRVDRGLDGDDRGLRILPPDPVVGQEVPLEGEAGPRRVDRGAGAREQRARQGRGAEREGQVLHALAGHAQRHHDVDLASARGLEHGRPVGQHHRPQSQTEGARQRQQHVGVDAGDLAVVGHRLVGARRGRRHADADLGQPGDEGTFLVSQHAGMERGDGRAGRHAEVVHGGGSRGGGTKQQGAGDGARHGARHDAIQDLAPAWLEGISDGDPGPDHQVSCWRRAVSHGRRRSPARPRSDGSAAIVPRMPG
jgi:hypothetical protein